MMGPIGKLMKATFQAAARASDDNRRIGGTKGAEPDSMAALRGTRVASDSVATHQASGHGAALG